MKLPFDLGVKLIFRLLVPGFFLTLGLYPSLATLRDKESWQIDIEYLFVLSVIVTGWMTITLDQPIYMFLEGRRFWPQWLRKLFVASEQRRLNKLLNKDDKFYTLAKAYDARVKEEAPGGAPPAEGSSKDSARKNAHQKYVEASVEERKFPLNDEGELEAKFPTRLGNLIDAFESYPDKRYGIDAIFYWYRIWLMLDKDLREELDNRQAVADSAVYASFACFVSGALWSAYAVLSLLQNPPVKHLPAVLPLWLPPVGFLLASRLFYQASLFPQYQFGETFKSVFDVFQNRIDISRALREVSGIVEDARLLNMSRQDQLMVAWRYLHNYKVKCTVTGCPSPYPMSPDKMAKHFEEAHGVKPEEEESQAAKPDHKAYYSNLVAAYDAEWYARLTKVCGALLSFAALILGFYHDYRIFSAALLISLIAWVVEILLRRKQRRVIPNLRTFEKSNHLPYLYKELPANFGVKRPVVLSHLLTFLLALVLLILWGAGVLR